MQFKLLASLAMLAAVSAASAQVVTYPGYVSLTFPVVPTGLSNFTITPNNYEYGTYFTPLTNGFITDLVFYKPSADAVTTRSMRLWTSGGSQLATCTTSSEPTGSARWIDCQLGSPFPVSAGTTYVASVQEPLNGVVAFVATLNCQQQSTPWITCVTNKDINTGYGFPNGANASTVFVDVVFTPL